MTRAVIVGSGSEIPPTRVTNDMLARVMDTSDAWIRERSGVEARHYVERGVGDLRPRRGRRAAGPRDAPASRPRTWTSWSSRP